MTIESFYVSGTLYGNKNAKIERTWSCFTLKLVTRSRTTKNSNTSTGRQATRETGECFTREGTSEMDSVSQYEFVH